MGLLDPLVSVFQALWGYHDTASAVPPAPERGPHLCPAARSPSQHPADQLLVPRRASTRQRGEVYEAWHLLLAWAVRQGGLPLPSAWDPAGSQSLQWSFQSPNNLSLSGRGGQCRGILRKARRAGSWWKEKESRVATARCQERTRPRSP